MKVSLLINELNIRGGTHKQFLRLCEFLNDQKVDFEIITKYFDKDKTYPEFSSFTIKCLNKENNNAVENKYLKHLLNIIDSLKLLKLISRDSTLCNIHDNGLSILFPILKSMKKKIIWQVNDLPVYFKEGNSKKSKSNLLGYIVKIIFKKFTVKFIDEITVNVTKNSERIYKHLSVNSKVFYCGIDSLKHFKTHSWPKKESIKLLTTGVFFPYRNYETSIEIVKKLHSDGVACTLHIIGETSWNHEYSEKIINIINEKKLQNSITIHGQVNEAKFKSLFDDADIFLFLNLDQSWGLVVFEAMSVGLPTIVSESVGAVEILNDQSAIIVDPLDVTSICEKIIILKENEELYNNYSIAAINHVDNMSWDNMYSSKMLDLFRKIQ